MRIRAGVPIPRWPLRLPRPMAGNGVLAGPFLYQSSFVDGRVGKTFVVGVLRYSASDLVAIRKKGARISIRVIGALVLARDVTPDLVDAVVERVRVTGTARMPADVRERLEARGAI